MIEHCLTAEKSFVCQKQNLVVRISRSSSTLLCWILEFTCKNNSNLVITPCDWKDFKHSELQGKMQNAERLNLGLLQLMIINWIIIVFLTLTFSTCFWIALIRNRGGVGWLHVVNIYNLKKYKLSLFYPRCKNFFLQMIIQWLVNFVIWLRQYFFLFLDRSPQETTKNYNSVRNEVEQPPPPPPQQRSLVTPPPPPPPHDTATESPKIELENSRVNAGYVNNRTDSTVPASFSHSQKRSRPDSPLVGRKRQKSVVDPEPQPEPEPEFTDLCNLQPFSSYCDRTILDSVSTAFGNVLDRQVSFCYWICMLQTVNVLFYFSTPFRRSSRSCTCSLPLKSGVIFSCQVQI